MNSGEEMNPVKPSCFVSFGIAFALVFGLTSPAGAQFRPGIEHRTIQEDSLRNEDSSRNVETPIFTPKKKEFLKNDVAFGGTVGTPGGLNFIAEGYDGPIGLRLEAGGVILLGFIAGWQADISYVLERGSDALLECSAIFYQNEVESFDAGDATYNTALGIGLAVNAGGFFIQLGIGHVYSTDSHTGIIHSPSLINVWPTTVQFGYVH